MTNPIEEAVALLPWLKEEANQIDHFGTWHIAINDQRLQRVISALEAMTDQKARDDAIWNEAVKAASSICVSLAEEKGRKRDSGECNEDFPILNHAVFSLGDAAVKVSALTKPSELVVVPREPTEEILRAMVNVVPTWDDEINAAKYRAMLKAME